MEQEEYLIWMHNIPQIGLKSIRLLMDLFVSPKELYYASKEVIYSIPNITISQKESIISNKNLEPIKKKLDWMKKNNIHFIIKNQDKYPKHLNYIYDPPEILYYKGELLEEDNIAVSIVGARKSTVYGNKIAYELAKELAKNNITVISGLARGIDGYAHEGALSVGGRTIAILGCGVDVCYPPENKKLKSQIEEKGAVCSEFFIGTPPLPNHFPRRNRIISGMSLGVIVVEAAKRSGSLITADQALEQGKEIFAVPGNINSKMSEGCNWLIKQGCKLVTSVEDILEELNLQSLKRNDNGEKVINLKHTLEEKEKKLYDCIKEQPTYIEEIISKLDYTVSEISGTLTILEIKGVIKQLPGKFFIRT